MVANGPVQSASAHQFVVVTFNNITSTSCTLFGYPGGDLVTAAGGVLVHLIRRPAARTTVTIRGGGWASATVEASTIDTATGNSCQREGTLVITPPNDFRPTTLPVAIPICNASIGTVAPGTDGNP